MIINKQGATRITFLTKRYAIKVPRYDYGWKSFLYGLLGNMQEKDFNTLKSEKMCPVLFSLPLGLLIVMPRCRIIREGELSREYLKEFASTNVCVNGNEYEISCEYKEDSFGYLNNKLVCVDYGS